MFFFFFNDTATTEIYTLSLHDALPISWRLRRQEAGGGAFLDLGLQLLDLGLWLAGWPAAKRIAAQDRKSTRLNSSHGYISYAVFCLKKKKQALITRQLPYNNGADELRR